MYISFYFTLLRKYSTSTVNDYNVLFIFIFPDHDFAHTICIYFTYSPPIFFVLEERNRSPDPINIAINLTMAQEYNIA